MRLSMIYEAYWQPISNHPGQLGKLDKRAKKNDKSFLVHPEDRKRWLKWFGGSKIKEDLDDKDEFAKSWSEPEVSDAIVQLREYVKEHHEDRRGIKILQTMERLYASLFGQPYNPTPDLPRM